VFSFPLFILDEGLPLHRGSRKQSLSAVLPFGFVKALVKAFVSEERVYHSTKCLRALH
jgi:hypothetical protein